MNEHFRFDDSVLPRLKLTEPCAIRISITDDFVKLYVGPRDWEWERRDGTLTASGTNLDQPKGAAK